jgi:hypothetical protein
MRLRRHWCTAIRVAVSIGRRSVQLNLCIAVHIRRMCDRLIFRCPNRSSLEQTTSRRDTWRRRTSTIHAESGSAEIDFFETSTSTSHQSFSLAGHEYTMALLIRLVDALNSYQCMPSSRRCFLSRECSHLFQMLLTPALVCILPFVAALASLGCFRRIFWSLLTPPYEVLMWMFLLSAAAVKSFGRLCDLLRGSQTHTDNKISNLHCLQDPQIWNSALLKK